MTVLILPAIYVALILWLAFCGWMRWPINDPHDSAGFFTRRRRHA